MTGNDMQATLDQTAGGQFLVAIGPTHMAVGPWYDIGQTDRGHGVQQPQVLDADGQAQIG
jgi:aminoglycoside/choline kinase family phosphotransferase